MIAFAEIHPGWFAVIAIAVECAVIFGLMLLLPHIAMNERPAWMDDLLSPLPGGESGSPATRPPRDAREPTQLSGVR